jgi:3-oxoacyl-[acyl-carrier protein] reductase
MKRALVTGGSGEIGAAICHRLARAGMDVLVHASSRPERAHTLATEIVAAGGSARAVVFDVTDAQGTAETLGELVAETPIQVLVNNAGVHVDVPMAGMSPAQWKCVLDVCLTGFFNVTQPLLLPMMATRWGRIISMSSVAAVMGNRGQVNYAAAKSGLHGASKALALELATRGVTVNVVAPGIIATPMTEGVFDSEMINRLVPMKRAGTPEEVAALVAFLASDEASYISGQVISINGAMA